MKKNPRKSVQILGINVSVTTTTRVLLGVAKKIKNNPLSRLFIVTPNPEIIVLAQESKSYQDILNQADFAIPDGVGLTYAARFLKLSKFNVIRGRELFLDLIKLANENNWKVFLLGGVENASAKAGNKFKKLYPNLNIKSYDGPMLDKEGRPLTESDREKESTALRRINIYKPHLLFVAYGAPKQERWTAKWIDKLDVGLAMVVGGSFDYVAGSSKVPPQIIASLGFEWLWRLVNDPTRITRIINAVFIFPLMVLDEKLQRD